MFIIRKDIISFMLIQVEMLVTISNEVDELDYSEFRLKDHEIYFIYKL